MRPFFKMILNFQLLHYSYSQISINNYLFTKNLIIFSYYNLLDNIPYTFSNKKVEIAVTKIIHGMPVANRGALRNLTSLDFYMDMKDNHISLRFFLILQEDFSEIQGQDVDSSRWLSHHFQLFVLPLQ